MNQGRIWCVVNPTVGLPLFIGGVAVTSLVVHASVLTNVSWFANYWEGANAKAAMNETTIAPVASNVLKTDSGYVITVTVSPDAATKLSSAEGIAKPDTVTLAAAAVE